MTFLAFGIAVGLLVLWFTSLWVGSELQKEFRRLNKRLDDLERVISETRKCT